MSENKTKEKVFVCAEFAFEKEEYNVRFLHNERGAKVIEINKLPSKNDTKGIKLVEFFVSVWKAPEPYPARIIGWCDSSSGEEGEIAHQMFNPRVYRKPYSSGIVFMATTSTVYNLEALGKPGLLEAAIQTFLIKQRKEYISYGETDCDRVYFTYFGLLSLEEDSDLWSIFKGNRFAVFRCLKPLCGSEDNYIALYCSDVIGKEYLIQKQAQTKEFPKKKENGYIDCRFPEELEEDIYITSSHNAKIKQGKVNIKYSFHNEYDDFEPADPSFILETSFKKNRHKEEVPLLDARFSVTNFGLAGSELLQHLDEDEPRYEVGRQLFYPPVERDPYYPGKVILLGMTIVRNADILEADPTILRNVLFAIVDSLHKELEVCRDYFINTYLVYMGRLNVSDEEINKLEYDFEKEEAEHKRKTDALLYDLFKKAGIPVFRCKSKGKSYFGENDYIAFVSTEDTCAFANLEETDEDGGLIWKNYIDEKGNFTLPPVEEFPQVMLKKKWNELLRSEQQGRGSIYENMFALKPRRITRIYNYDPLKDIFGYYVYRDLYFELQEHEYEKNS